VNDPEPVGQPGASHVAVPPRFHDQFAALFNAHFKSLYRYLDRLSGEPDLAADLAQEAFIRLFQRGSLPDSPKAWLVTVSMNLFRNVRSAERRRIRLLTVTRAEALHSDPAPSAEAAEIDAESARGVRAAVDRIPLREKQLLLLAAEGYSYRDIAASLQLNEASVGTLLARARRTFRARYLEERNASR
jgi:RNA polymerase sigma-70 factor, ECF subfamily